METKTLANKFGGTLKQRVNGGVCFLLTHAEHLKRRWDGDKNNMSIKELALGLFAAGFPLYRFVLEDGSVMVSRSLMVVSYLAERGIEVVSWGVY